MPYINDTHTNAHTHKRKEEGMHSKLDQDEGTTTTMGCMNDENFTV